ncbi:MAG: helix-turn-helix transcriptional regulator [Chitinophagaceae bacterium]|nr:helix-turn-helix transcriptional regulator [Chitinophagaceae bacterium]
MSISHQTLSHEPLVWNDELPPGFKGERLPGGILHSASGDFGELCLQNFAADQFTIQYNTFDLRESFTLQHISRDDGVHSKLLIKGKSIETFNLDESVPFTVNQFSLVESSEYINTSTLGKGLHVSFDAYFSKPMLIEMKSLFPGHRLWQKELPDGGRADNDIHMAVHSILRCKFEKELREHFYFNRVKDLLFHYLLQSGDKLLQNQPSEKEVQAVLQAEEIISGNIAEHHSIPDLSRRVLLNEFRLKAVFKIIFRMGPYEYLVRKRLIRGRELLESGLSIKEVAAIVGYRPSDFTIAFRQHFGYVPSAVKKNTGNQ